MIDPYNTNIIPYDKTTVMFHMCKNAVESPDGTFWEDYDDKEDLDFINKAAEKSGGNAKVTPKVVLDKNEKGTEEALKFIADLNELRNDYELQESDTILEYKKRVIMKYIRNRFKDFDMEVLEALCERWTSQKTPYSMYWFRQRMDATAYNSIREFERHDLPKLRKKVISPIESIFIKVGNKVISKTKNLANSGNESKAVSKIRKQILDIIDLTDKIGSEKDKDNLEQLLVKLDQAGNEICASEGFVFRYGGRLLKLTGSFAIINAMNSIKYKR